MQLKFPAVALSLCWTLAGACASQDSVSEDDFGGDSTTDGGMLACEPPEAADLSSPYLQVSNHTGGTICAGVLPMLDQEVERLLALMDLPLDVPIALAYGEAAVAEQCAGPSSPEYVRTGCAPGFGCGARAVATFRSQVHELVHVVRRRNLLWGPPMIEEGLAKVLGDERPLRATVGGVSNLPLPNLVELFEHEGTVATPEEYSYGGHFLLYCAEHYGLEAVLDAVTDPRYPQDLPALFEEHLGDSFESIERGWKENGWGQLYVGPLPCDELVDLDTVIAVSTTLDCSSTTTLGYQNTRMVSQPSDTCFVAHEPTEVSVITSGVEGHVNLIGYNCNAQDLDNPDLVRAIRLTTGGEFEMTLARCTWVLDFDRPWGPGAHTLSVAIEPLSAG